jgi:nicotinate-nucleotide adenylyltransferase
VTSELTPSSEPPITPLPVPAGVPLVIFVGGTFDPPHLAHVALPARARDELEHEVGADGSGWLVFIPAARSPHKQDGPVGSGAQRRRMLELALADTPRTAVWTDELDRIAASPDAPSYTSTTISRARRWLDTNGSSSTRLRLLVGADQAAAFHRWHAPREIIALAEPAVMLRAPFATADSLLQHMRSTGAWSGDELRQWGGRVLDQLGVIDAAATSIRRELQEPAPHVGGVIDPRVLAYIRANGIYAPRTGG